MQPILLIRSIDSYNCKMSIFGETFDKNKTINFFTVPTSFQKKISWERKGNAIFPLTIYEQSLTYIKF